MCTQEEDIDRVTPEPRDPKEVMIRTMYLLDREKNKPKSY